MIHIDTSELTPSGKWKTKADELAGKLNDAKTKAERDAIIDGNYHWRAFKEELKKLSYGKCWYSEAREIYSHYHVDHFRPKKQQKIQTVLTKVVTGGWLTTGQITGCVAVSATQKRATTSP